MPDLPSLERPPFWCSTCGLDLQSAASMSIHKQGRKHLSRLKKQSSCDDSQQRRRRSSRPQCPDLEVHEFYQALAAGRFRNIVVVTGAGVSTSADIPDFRSPGTGLFDMLRKQFGPRFPQVHDNPEALLHRTFVSQHPDVWESEIHPRLLGTIQGAVPTLTHKFCEWLHRQGWLRRVYTQNIDGLHTHPSLGALNHDKEKVVECHGSFRRPDSLVFYGDDLPNRFFEACREDFDNPDSPVDCTIVLGTSLQVAPVCAVPNLTPRGAPRILVSTRIADCCVNTFSKGDTTTLGGRKHTSLRALWGPDSKWPQCLVESTTDDFCRAFFDCIGLDSNDIVSP